MLRIWGERRSGKTAALIGAFSGDPQGVLVVMNNDMRDYIKRRWPDVRDKDVVSVRSIPRAIAGRGQRLYVDELGEAQLPPSLEQFVVAAVRP